VRAEDCQNGVCLGGKCAAPSCSDFVTNGDETDVDCGGGYCPPCASGRSCVVNSDCDRKSCSSGVCV
jgi:hypothetical protein